MPKIPGTSISQLIAGQQPEFVRSQYPTFIAFLEAYYEWMEQNGGAVAGVTNFLSYKDIDETLPNFIQYFMDEFMPNIPATVLANKPLLLKHIKQFYRARGSQKSYEFLFRILYNEPVTIYYPGSDLLRVSAGEWSVSQVLRSTTFHNTFNFIGRVITGFTSGAQGNVENVIQFQIGTDLISEIYLSGIVGTFVSDEKIVCNTASDGIIEETLFNLVTGITITNPGTRYQIGDIILISGGGGQNASASVASTTGVANGRIVTAANTFILNPGAGQTVIPPFIQLANFASQVDDYYTGMEIEIVDGPDTGDIKTIVGYVGSTQVATVDSDWVVVPTIAGHYQIQLGMISTIQMKDFGIGYDFLPSANFTLSGDGTATGICNIGPLGIYPGMYLNSDGFLSDIKIIQDSHYWQVFSYVLQTQNSINIYQDIVTKLLHPAGTILFGEVEIVDEFQIFPDYRTLERHKFYFPPYQGFNQTYPYPNSDYWKNPTLIPPINSTSLWGNTLWKSGLWKGIPSSTEYGNTQISIWADVVNSLPDASPGIKQNIVSDPYIGITNYSIPTIPTDNLVVEYDCIEESNPQILYDIKGFSPLYNGFLGSTFSTDPNDPVYVSTGLNFAGAPPPKYANAATVPVSPLNQTVMIVANMADLTSNQSLIGCIDSNNDTTTTGFEIYVNTDGSLHFRSNKFNGIGNNLDASLSPGTIVPGTWFCATLRYGTNSIKGTLNNQLSSSVTANYGTNIDGSGIISDSTGWFLGNQGVVPPFKASSLWGNTLWKSGFWKFTPTTNVQQLVDNSYWGRSLPGQSFWGGEFGLSAVTIPIPGIGNPFDGFIAYVIIWNRVLSDNEVTNSYLFLQSYLTSRGITLP